MIKPILFFVSAIMLVSCSQQKTEETTDAPQVYDTTSAPVQPVKRNPLYQIASADTNEFKYEITLDIVVQERITVQEMIVIAHSEKSTSGMDGKFCARFFLYSRNNNAYANICYFKDCSDCTNSDPDGNEVV